VIAKTGFLVRELGFRFGVVMARRDNRGTRRLTDRPSPPANRWLGFSRQGFRTSYVDWAIGRPRRRGIRVELGSYAWKRDPILVRSASGRAVNDRVGVIAWRAGRQAHPWTWSVELAAERRCHPEIPDSD